MRTFGHGWKGKFTQIAIASGGGAIVKPSSPLGAMWPYLTVAKLTSLFFVWKIKQGKDTVTLRQLTCVVKPRLEVLLQSVFSVFMVWYSENLGVLSKRKTVNSVNVWWDEYLVASLVSIAWNSWFWLHLLDNKYRGIPEVECLAKRIKPNLGFWPAFGILSTALYQVAYSCFFWYHRKSPSPSK